MSRAQLNIRVNRPSDWQDYKQQSHFDDSEVLSRTNTVVADLPTYGYRRVWAMLRRASERDGQPVVNAKRVYRVMKAYHQLVERKPVEPGKKRAHKGCVAAGESNRRWCSDGFEFSCDREVIDWVASTGGYDKETVQYVMLGAIEKRFGRQLPTEPLE